MAIDKDSSGIPEVDFKRRTTKVNLSMVLGIVVFFAIVSGVVWWFSHHS